MSNNIFSQLTLQQHDDEFDDGGDLALEIDKPKLKRPPLYKVVLLNDDYTPMEFVIEVLEQFFSMDKEKATRVMLMVHTEGKGVCGIFSRDIAETKARPTNPVAPVMYTFCEMEFCAYICIFSFYSIHVKSHN